MNKSSSLKHFTIGKGTARGVFVTHTLKDGRVAKVMNQTVFQSAVSSANQKLKVVSTSFLKSNGDGRD